MKRVFVVNYSQTGQLSEIAEQVITPLHETELIPATLGFAESNQEIALKPTAPRSNAYVERVLLQFRLWLRAS